MCSVSDNPVVELNIVAEPPPKTNNETSAMVTNVHRCQVTAARRPFAFLKRMWPYYFPPVKDVVKSVSANPEVELSIVEKVPAETHNETSAMVTNVHRCQVTAARRPFVFLKRMWPYYFPPETLGVKDVVKSVSANPVVELSIVEKVPAETHNETSAMVTNVHRFPVTARRPFVFLKRMWPYYFPPETLRVKDVVKSVFPNPVVELNIVEEVPAETNKVTDNAYRFPLIAARRSLASLKRMWSDYFRPETSREEAVMKRRSAFKLVIIGLFSFAAIKSQGGTRFPFQTHPRISMVSVTSLLVYGLASKAEDVISAAPSGPNSVYAVTARLGRALCRYIFVGSLASLFYV